MKKIIFAASLLATTFFSAKAQDASTTTTSTSTDGYKPVAGDVTAEFALSGGTGFIPDLNLSNQPTSNTSVAPALRLRYFLADDLALRLGLNISSTRTTEKFRDNTTTTPAPTTPVVDGERTTKTSTILLNLGAEKHFSGTERLDTYFGGDILFAIAGGSVKGENLSQGSTSPVTGNSFETKGSVGNAGFGFGLRVVGGADYYIAKKLYLGGEFGWGFLAFKAREIETTSTTVAGGTTTTSASKSEGNTSFTLSPSVVAGLKVGFVF